MTDAPLRKRLLASREVTIGYKQTETVFRNPDGPEAAARITALEAEVERLREALEFYATAEVEWQGGVVTFQPGDDRGQRARAALAGGE